MINSKIKQEVFMKKLLIVLTLALLASSTLCYADKNWFDVELAKIRNVKEAKCDIINKQLAELSVLVARTQVDTTLTTAEKQQHINAYNNKISELNSQKQEIERQYVADKDTLKTRWKNGTESSNDIISKWVYDSPVTRIQPDEYYTTRTVTTETYPTKTVVTETQPATTVTTRTRNKFGEEPISNIVPKTVTKQYVEEPAARPVPTTTTTTTPYTEHTRTVTTTTTEVPSKYQHQSVQRVNPQPVQTTTTSTTTTPYTEHTRTVTTTTTEVPSKYQHQSVQRVNSQPVQTTQTTTYYSQPAQTTTTYQTTTYTPQTTVKEKQETYTYDRNIDPANFKVILH